MKIFLLRVLSVLVTMGIVLVLFEYYLRSVESHVVNQGVGGSGGFIETNPELLVDYAKNGRRLLPNAHVIIRNHALSKEDIKIDTNSLGFRYPEISADKSPGEYRVQVLGDSITIADYLPAEDGWTAIAERALNSPGASVRYSMINAGLGNFSLEDEVRVFRETRDKVRPDLALIAFYLNDSRPPWGFTGGIGGRNWWRRHSLIIEMIYRHFKLAEWVDEGSSARFQWIADQKKLKWADNKDEFVKLIRSAAFDWGSAWDSGSWEIVRRHLTEMKQLAAESGTKVAVAMFPVSFQVEAKFLEDEPQRKMREMAAEFGFPFYDLLPDLRAANQPGLFYDQCHLTRPGNTIAGEKIAKFVSEIK